MNKTYEGGGKGQQATRLRAVIAESWRAALLRRDLLAFLLIQGHRPLEHSGCVPASATVGGAVLGDGRIGEGRCIGSTPPQDADDAVGSDEKEALRRAMLPLGDPGTGVARGLSRSFNRSSYAPRAKPLSDH